MIETFVLAPSKDLAVSLFDFAQDKSWLIRRFAQQIINYALGTLTLSGLGVTVRTSGITADGRYPLPLPFNLPANKQASSRQVSGLSSPSRFRLITE